MKNTLKCWQTVGFVFTSVLGTFLHFLFDLTGGSAAAALVSAVNESIFEHMKLLFYPMAVFAAVEYRFLGKEYPGFLRAKAAGILLGLALIPVVYYTYTGILGMSADWFNIAIFFIAAAAAYSFETWLLRRGSLQKKGSASAVAALCLAAVLFTVFTFLPPRIPFFRDPVTGTYGFFQTGGSL